MSDSYNLGGDGKSFSFDKIGDRTGRCRIVDFEEMQQTDMQSGKPAVWDDGRAKMMLRIDLQTTLRTDDSDDGVRSVFIRGSKKAESKSSLAAVAGAVKAASGGTAIQIGADLDLAYVGETPAKQRGFNPAKQYEAQYWPKSANVVADSPAPATVNPAAVPVTAEANGGTVLSPEQIAALVAANAPKAEAVDPIAAHPQGAALRAAGVPDDVIKASLGLA